MKKQIAKFEAQAAACGDARGFWQSASLLLVIWSSGMVPAAGYGPQVCPELFNAFKKFGSEFRAAIDQRAFAA